MIEEVPFVSRIKSSPSVTRKPSDLLMERSALTRHITRGHDVPAIDDFMRHAERYGTEQVVETAAEIGYGIDACIRLMDHCDRVNAVEYKKSFPHRPAERIKSSEVRCNAILGIEEDAEKNEA